MWSEAGSLARRQLDIKCRCKRQTPLEKGLINRELAPVTPSAAEARRGIAPSSFTEATITDNFSNDGIVGKDTPKKQLVDLGIVARDDQQKPLQFGCLTTRSQTS